METHRLGTSDLQVSRIGFGCWAIGGHGYGHVDDAASIAAVKTAMDKGVNFFDTADVYGFGHSETILSKALGAQRHKVVIATKFGVTWDRSGRTSKDCSAKRVVKALEGSLKRLKVDCIPLYQIHWHDGITPIEEVMEALVRCRDAGKIRYIGCSNFSENLLSKASRTSKLVSCQYLYNIANRENEAVMTFSSIKLGMSVLAYGVIGRGVFSAKYHKDSRFGENDTRMRDPEFIGKQYTNNLILADQLRGIGKKYGKSPVQVAICWALDNPNVACAITGFKTAEQVSENVGSVGWSLDHEDVMLLNAIASETRHGGNYGKIR